MERCCRAQPGWAPRSPDLGRGAGNCPTELLVGFLKNPKFHLRLVRECVQDLFVPLSKKLDWGHSIPHMFTGQLNIHPRMAIEVRDSDTPDAYVEFYDRLTENTDCGRRPIGRAPTGTASSRLAPRPSPRRGPAARLPWLCRS
jgi:hypothetical protein